MYNILNLFLINYKIDFRIFFIIFNFKFKCNYLNINR